mgnify:CR=1 FL=1
MKRYSCADSPLKVFGIPFFDKKRTFERIPPELRAKLLMPDILGRRCPGARIGFRTDAEAFTVKVVLKTLEMDVGMSLYGCQAIYVMVGNRADSYLAGHMFPADYQTKSFELTFHKRPVMEDVTLWLLRNEEIESVDVFFPDRAIVEEPTPYRYGKVLYYGSSITEGGSATSVVNNYPALLSRWLDMDFYNFGFSGNAKGEPEMADYINTIDMSVFVLDYDHNAPTPEHLRSTHEPFFLKIREKHPNMPILLLSRPNFNFYDVDDSEERRAIIETTYRNAILRGDNHVYYIDGEALFGVEDRQLCTVDRTHPNDLGFYRMAKTILPVMKAMLNV